MAFLSINEPGFWRQNIDKLQAIVDAGGGEGLDMSLFMLGDESENPPYVIPLRMEPGYVLARHAHNCHRMEIVVQGSLLAGDKVLGPGSIMISEPGEMYGPHVAGPDGCTTFEIFSNFKGGTQMTVERGSGELMELEMSSPDNARKMVENAKQQQAAHRN